MCYFIVAARKAWYRMSELLVAHAAQPIHRGKLYRREQEVGHLVLLKTAGVKR